MAGHEHSPQKVFPMAKGDGEDSYSQNSELQAFLTTVPQLALNDALDIAILPPDGSPVVVADLGSSSGPNSIDVMARIVGKLRQRLPKDATIQAYFNDLPSSDFNNLFQLLSNDSRAKNFYAAGVPGSYYDRLFPESSVHVFHSSSSLHWLSKIPDAVLYRGSSAFNREKTWITHSRSAVAGAYQQQAVLDLKNFLLDRAAELVSGGLLFFLCNGRSTSEPNKPMADIVEKFASDLDEILTDLVAEGLLTEQQRDAFNIPIYNRSIEDIREAIAYCGSMFDVVTTKIHKVDLNAKEVFGVSEPAGANDLSGKIKGMWKAALKNLLEAYFGKNVADVIWQRYDILLEKTSGVGLCSLSICAIGLIRT